MTRTAPTLVSTEIKEYILDNGLTVWLNEDHSQPKVFGAVVVLAGSKDSPNTGIAHYFEHMMFKGTDRIGTIDYKAEKVFLDAIEGKYEELAATKNRKRREEIQMEINELSIRAADYVIPNEFDRLITKYGGSKLNAGTSYDYTVYHNLFSPQYIEQWAELNSERLIRPVFRMFQSELETVYEEKNRRDDMILNRSIERLMETYFRPHPYAYPIIGSAENLKNPRLSEMKRFFKTYYVSSNMGLILSGDFDTRRALPIIERTFSRIPRGVPDVAPMVKIRPFRGRERTAVKVPLPLLKAVALGFRGVPANHPDQPALDVAAGILNNSNGTGYLDRLMVERRVMGAMIGGESFNEAGFIGIVVVPRLSHTCRSAERMIWRELERVKQGDFTDEIFNSLKREQLRRHLTELEDIDSRSQIMVRLFSQGKTWADYREELSRAEALTKDDVVRVANKYFGANYLFVKKKTGRYPKERLTKPGFAPIVPKHADAESAYSQWLDRIPVEEVRPSFIDFERDVHTLHPAEGLTLYITPNRVNNIFTLKLSYAIGLIEEPRLKLLTGYIPLLGTASQSFDALHTRLQTLGSTLDLDADEHCLNIKITGFDTAFDETLGLVGRFIAGVKPDDRKLKTLIDDARVAEKAFFKSNNEVAEALFEYVQYGHASQFLTRPSLREVKHTTGRELVDLFRQAVRRVCTAHYCGTLSAERVSERTLRAFATDVPARLTATSDPYRDFVSYDHSRVFFYHMPDVFQNIIYVYMPCDPLPTLHERHTAGLFSLYFGEGMSSLMFQEIREYRSLAYYTSGAYRLPPFRLADRPTRFVAYLSTQCDKTIDALEVLDALISHMPEHPERIDALIRTEINRVNNAYPAFRDISTRIADFRRDGYTDDPHRALLNDIRRMTIDDITRFYRSYVRGRTPVYVVVGNFHRIDKRRLSAFGEITRVRHRDFYR